MQPENRRLSVLHASLERRFRSARPAISRSASVSSAARPIRRIAPVMQVRTSRQNASARRNQKRIRRLRFGRIPRPVRRYLLRQSALYTLLRRNLFDLRTVRADGSPRPASAERTHHRADARGQRPARCISLSAFPRFRAKGLCRIFRPASEVFGTRSLSLRRQLYVFSGRRLSGDTAGRSRSRAGRRASRRDQPTPKPYAKTILPLPGRR